MNLNSFELVASKREQVGSGAARMFRKQNKVPATIYGHGDAAISAVFDLDVLKKALASKTLFNQFTTLTIGKEKYLVVAKIVQKHPVTDRILHIDFQIVEKKSEIKMRVPVRFINREICEAIKLGAVLNIIHDTVELVGSAEKMPAYVEFDLKNASVLKAIKISDYQFEQGVKPAFRYNNVNIATILAAKKKGGTAEEEAAEGAAA